MSLSNALLLFNLIHTAIIFDFMRIMYRKRFKNNLFYILGYIGFYVLDNGINYFHKPSVNVIGEFVLIQVFSYILFKNFDKKFFYNFIFYLYSIFLNLVIFSIFSIFNNNVFFAQLQEDVFARFFINFFIFAITYRYVIQALKDNLHYFIAKINTFLVIVIGWQVFVLVFFLEDNSPNAPFALLFLLFSFLCIGLCMISLFSSIEYGSKVKERIHLYQQQAILLLKNVDAMKEKNQEIRKLAHDLSAHLQVAATLSQTENKEYRKKLSEKLLVLKQSVNSGHRIIDSIFDNEIIRAYEKDINLEIETEKMDWTFMRDLDITSMFSNMMNNAIEACEALPREKRRIAVSIFERGVYRIILCENTYNAKEILISNDKFFSTKKSHLGIGLDSIKETVEKYDGDVQFHIGNDKFSVKIAIPLPEGEEI